ncbi:kinase-like domain-containing protein [Aspergillus cavernicola]|uniref:EKC/KEOPS complex subunit BUD32 n=1 Tax=Aspergillus cavernicola TaxID=176166 RepID=A0ABR4HHT2_9EURO
MKRCSQAAEAIQYIHQKGVIHSDLRPDNYLLDTHSDHSLDLLLCDFGGSTNGVINGGRLPDPGFFNLCKPWVSTDATDIFSLGSIFYTIMTGHWPYRSPGPFQSVEKMRDYEDLIGRLFTSKQYPLIDEIDDLIGDKIIQGRWRE